MRTILTIFFCICLLLGVVTISKAKGWRDIVPLHSTREDVVKLLGEPPAPPADGTRFYTLNKGRSIYYIDGGEIYIVFSGGVREYHECAKQLPEDTVLLIKFSPKHKFSLADLQVDENRLKKFDPSSPPNIGFEGYLEDKEGLVIRAFKGAVDEVNYIAAFEDRHLCPTYYQEPEKFIRILVHFDPPNEPEPNVKLDEYGALRWEDEKARLGKLAAHLEQDANAQGYVIAYPGRRQSTREARARANRAMTHLVKVLKMDAGRIVTVVGGRREQEAIELFAVPSGTVPPVPTPTVSTRVVQHHGVRIKHGNRRKRAAS